MLAETDLLTVMFGSLGGLAALVVAINTWLIRREAKKAKDVKDSGMRRMDTFETSQLSLQTALTRADVENERLRDQVNDQEEEIGRLKLAEIELERLKLRVADQEKEIERLKAQVASLKTEVKGLKHEQ